jgi:hypothetical protein
MPFEIKEINITKDGFLFNFTKPIDKKVAANPEIYAIETYTHEYKGAYGSPEVDQTQLKVTKAVPSEDGLSVRLYLDKIIEGHIHDFSLTDMKSKEGKNLLHTKAYYTVNEIPKN